MFLLQNHHCKDIALHLVLHRLMLEKSRNLYILSNYSDDFTEMIVEKMRDNPEVVKLGSIGLSILIILGIFIVFSAGKKDTSEKKKDSKKKT